MPFARAAEGRGRLLEGVDDLLLVPGVDVEAHRKLQPALGPTDFGQRLVVIEVREAGNPAADKLVLADAFLPVRKRVGYIEVNVRVKSFLVFPVFRKQHPAHSTMRRIVAFYSGQRSK